MAIELLYLAGFSVLFFLTLATQGIVNNLSRAHGPKLLAGSRDELPPDTVIMGRARRAVQNSIEAAVLFVPAVAAVAFGQAYGAHSAVGAAVFFWSRVFFVPAYLLGVPWLRSLIWFASVVGVGMIWVQFFSIVMQG
jgi:uncharacterized MAPEG superfamily protein